VFKIDSSKLIDNQFIMSIARIIVFENEKTWAKVVANNSTDEFHRKFNHAIVKDIP